MKTAGKKSKKGEVAGRMDEASSVFAVLVSVDMGGDWDIRYLVWSRAVIYMATLFFFFDRYG